VTAQNSATHCQDGVPAIVVGTEGSAGQIGHTFTGATKYFARNIGNTVSARNKAERKTRQE